MRAVVVSGICVEHDAISAIAAWQAETLQRMPEVEHVALVAQHHARKTSVPTVTVGDAWSFVNLEVVKQADLVIYHWGVYYDLFDSITVIGRSSRVVVHFHNYTPPHLLNVEQRELQARGERQLMLTALAQPIWWADSAYNGEALRQLGLAAGDVPVVSSPVVPSRDIGTKQRFGDAVTLLSVGRLVPAKGVLILIDALAEVVRELEGRVTLAIVANTSFSDAEYEARLADQIAELGLTSHVRVLLDISDDDLWHEYSAADVFVSPSLHEGLCVPVIEAYQAGCRVVSTDGGNLPYIVQPPDPVVPAGEPEPLARAIVALAREIAGQPVRRRPEVEAVLAGFSGPACEAALAAHARAAVEHDGDR